MQLHNKRSLESFRIFPYIAWTLIVLFALFVYNLSNRVSEATEQLQSERSQAFDITTASTTTRQ